MRIEINMEPFAAIAFGMSDCFAHQLGRMTVLKAEGRISGFWTEDWMPAYAGMTA